MLLTLVAACLLAGCTNSKLVIAPLYNRLDDQMRKEFHKLGDFNDNQVAAFEDRVGTFHVWHRQAELPKYASLLSEISASIARPGQTSEQDMQRWIDTTEQFSQSVRECHPVNFSFDLMKTLTDDQVNFIERRFRRERGKNREKYESLTREERLDKRAKGIMKWAGRVGFEFTGEQERLLRSTLREQISLRQQYFNLSNTWKRKLFTIARDQQSDNYDERMESQLQQLWRLLEDGYPEEWSANRTLWKGFAVEFEASMTGQQRRDSSAWIGKMAKTLSSISRDEPSFKAGNDPAVGCLVDSASAQTPLVNSEG